MDSTADHRTHLFFGESNGSLNQNLGALMVVAVLLLCDKALAAARGMEHLTPPDPEEEEMVYGGSPISCSADCTWWLAHLMIWRSYTVEVMLDPRLSPCIEQVSGTKIIDKTSMYKSKVWDNPRDNEAFKVDEHIFGFVEHLFISSAGETVEFGHATFFWNGNRSEYFNPAMEEYVEVPSDSGITFNVQPKMNALEISEKARDAIPRHKFDQMILDAVEQAGGIYVVTADHENAEDMVNRNKTGQPLLDQNGNIQILTSHALPPVNI